MRALLLVVLMVQWLGVLVSPHPMAPQLCPATPQNFQPDNCAKPLTGCICVSSVTGSYMSFPGCEGCRLDATVTWDCGIDDGIKQCLMDIPCGEVMSCSKTCRCTGEGWLSYSVTCGDCP